MQFSHSLIKKAIKHYKYDEPIDVREAARKYFENYERRYNNYKKNKYDFGLFYGTLIGFPESTHLAAKKMLWQGDYQCWKYFERTALFWTVSNINDEWIDHSKGALEYALYTERNDILDMLIKKVLAYMDSDVYQTDTEHKNQPVYPSTYLVHFLIEKWLGGNPALERIMEYGKGFGIYQPLIDNWDDYSSLEPTYFDELCEYHLNQISLTKPDKRDGEEFIGPGLVPMELINLIKVREKLGLDIPTIRHELFKTPMAAFPKIPTGYNENFDVIFQTVKLTAETKQQFSLEKTVDHIRKYYQADDGSLIF